MNPIDLSGIVIKKIYGCGSSYSSGSVTKNVKNRPLYAFNYKYTGKTVYTADKNEIISDEHTLLLMGKGADYEFTCIEPGKFYGLVFDADIPFLFNILSFQVNNPTEMAKQLDKIEKIRRMREKSAEYRLIAELYKLLAQLSDVCETPYSVLKKKKLLEPAVLYINEHFSDDEISNDFLAQLAGISTVYFRKLFTELYGVSPIRYLQQQRIEKAIDLFQTDFQSMYDIAIATGFSDQQSFSKAFRRTTGMSPTEYIRANQISCFHRK